MKLDKFTKQEFIDEGVEEMEEEREEQQLRKELFDAIFNQDDEDVWWILGRYEKDEDIFDDERVKKFIRGQILDDIHSDDSGYINWAAKIASEYGFEDFFINEYLYGLTDNRFSNEDIHSFKFAIKKEIGLSNDFFESKEFVDAMKEGTLNHLSNGVSVESMKLDYKLPKQFLESEPAVNAAKMGFKYTLKRVDFKNASQLIEEFNLSDEFIEKAAKEEFITFLKKGYIENAFFIVNRFKFDDSFYKNEGCIQAIKEGYLNVLEKNDFIGIKKIIKNEHYSQFINEDFLRNNQEYKKAAEGAFWNKAMSGNWKNAEDIADWHGFSKEFLDNSAEKVYIYELQNLKLAESRRKGVNDFYSFSKEFIESDEVKKAAKQGFLLSLEDCCQFSKIKEGKRIAEAYNFSKDFIKNETEKACLHFLQEFKYKDSYYFNKIKKFLEIYNLSENFLNSKEVVIALEEHIANNIEEKGLPYADKIKDSFKIKLSKEFMCALDFFGDNFNLDVYTIYKKISLGEIPESARKIGVESSGIEGTKEFELCIQKKKKEFIDGTLDVKEILDSSFLKPIIRHMCRFKKAQFGVKSNEEFERMLLSYYKNKNSLKPLQKEYFPSQIIDIKKVNISKNREYGEGFLSRYNTLLDSIKSARSLVDDEKALNKLQDKLREKQKAIIKKINEQISKQENPKAIKGLEMKKQKLEELNLSTIYKPQEMFNILMSFKGEFDEELRQLIFYGSFHFNQNEREVSWEDFDSENPSLDEISRVGDFVGHITKNEFSKKYFTNKQTIKYIKGLLNAKALDEEIKRFQSQATRRKMQMQFIPSRDLKTEFSGYISDACWASKYESILKEFPNFSSLTMVQNPESKKDIRMAGACILIETRSRGGTPLLVIRGLNPIENVINQLSVKDFYGKITDYLKEIAEKRGRKLAIVIDVDSGGSATNRPMLFNFLNNLRSQLRKIKLDSEKGTTFNTYCIVNDTYLVE